MDWDSHCLSVKPVRCVFCLLNIQSMNETLHIDTLQAGLQKGNISFSYNGFGRPTRCIHSLVTVTLWSSNIWPLKFHFTWQKLFPCCYNITSAFLTKLYAHFLYIKVPAILNIPSPKTILVCLCHKGKNCCLWLRSWMFQFSLAFYQSFWSTAVTPGVIVLYVRGYQAELSFQGWPQRNTTIHLQRFGPTFILVAALTVLHTLMKITIGKQNWYQQNRLGSASQWHSRCRVIAAECWTKCMQISVTKEQMNSTLCST